MAARHILSIAVGTALVTGLLSAPAAAEPPAASVGRSVDISASMQRAVRRAAVAQTAANPRKAHADTQNSNGGSSSGGGHSKMIIGLVTAAAGIGATVYAVQQARKTEDTLTATPH